MESKVLQYEFQVIKPIQLEKGKDIVGHASSSVTFLNLEKEVERLRKKLKEVESRKNGLDERIEDFIARKLDNEEDEEDKKTTVKKPVKKVIKKTISKVFKDDDSEFFDKLMETKSERKPNVRSKRSTSSRSRR